MNIVEATVHFILARPEWESKLPRTRKLEVYDSTQSKWVKGSWFVAPSSKDGLGLNFAFYRDNLPRGPRPCAPRGGARGGAGCRPQSSPILVEDAHAAVGVAEVPIIVRCESKPGVWAVNPRCDPHQRRFKHVGKIAPSLEKMVNGHWNHCTRPPSCPRE